MIKKIKFIMIIYFEVILFSQFISPQVLSKMVYLENKEYKDTLKDGSKMLINNIGNIVIDDNEIKYINVSKKDYFYETSGARFLDYKDFIYIDLVVEHYEYAAGFQSLINYKKNKILINRPFIYNPLKEIIGYDNFIIIIGVERIEVINLLEEKLQFQDLLPNKVDKVEVDNSGFNINYKNKTNKYFTYNELIILNNLNKNLSPFVESLRLREYPSDESKIIRKLIKGEKLELLEKNLLAKEYEETINGKKGTWVKVKTEKGEVGWCFDAYLEEVKKK